MERENSRNSSAVQKSMQAAQAVRGAIKTGKAVAGAAKGAAAGGPAGAVAAGLWQNRKTVVKVILAAGFILLLPILFVLMLPSLIFGGLGDNTNALNDNTVIMANLAQTDSIVQMALQQSYDAMMLRIQEDAEKLPEEVSYELINPYEGQQLYNASLLISQYCVFRSADYQTIRMDDFQRQIEQGREHLYSYTKEIKTETIPQEDGTEIIVTKAVYTVQYAGAGYFADAVFRLTDEQKAYAEEYAGNLNLFLADQR